VFGHNIRGVEEYTPSSISRTASATTAAEKTNGAKSDHPGSTVAMNKAEHGGSSSAVRKLVGLPATPYAERRRRASEALNAAFNTKAQRRAAIRAMSPQDKIQAARQAIEVLMERFNKTASLYP
jgi:hypothetical protein